MAISSKHYRLPPTRKLDLSRWPTTVDPLYDSDEDFATRLQQGIEALSTLQELLYAQGRQAILVIFQAMDAGGKDSAIKHVMSGVNPQGCQVTSFKQPSQEELAHDFLWRSTCHLPRRGEIGIFNRSYYEEVLIARVHPEVIERERLPLSAAEDPHFWKHRYASINDFEAHLTRNGTTLIKFFLHLSKQEQKKRFLKRLDRLDKLWKFSRDDLTERASWSAYITAYEHCLAATSTTQAPWYVVPADTKKNTRLIISHILIDILSGLDLRHPHPSCITPAQAKSFRRRLQHHGGA
jgi:PPK2 family polyphosphate:nucleotide phosphotransferase